MLLTRALQAVEVKRGAFEEQKAVIREELADAYTAQEGYIEAAKVLQAYNWSLFQRKLSDELKVRTWIRICRLYLEEDDTSSAESYLN